MICHTPEQVVLVDAATAFAKAYDARVDAEGEPIIDGRSA